MSSFDPSPEIGTSIQLREACFPDIQSIEDVTAADFDGDGDIDLALAYRGPERFDSRLVLNQVVDETDDFLDFQSEPQVQAVGSTETITVTYLGPLGSSGNVYSHLKFETWLEDGFEGSMERVEDSSLLPIPWPNTFPLQVQYTIPLSEIDPDTIRHLVATPCVLDGQGNELSRGPSTVALWVVDEPTQLLVYESFATRCTNGTTGGGLILGGRGGYGGSTN